MTPTSQALELARDETRRVLGASPTFAALPLEEQKAMYLDMVRARSQELAGAAGVSGALARRPTTAGDLIDDDRHANERMDKVGDMAADFMGAVDFPKFVKDLLKGVFDANLAVTIQQMEAYQNLLKTATKSLADYVKAIDPAASFAYLAENNSDDFSFDFDDGEKSGENPQGAVLTDKEGNKLDLGDNEIKAKIMDAKLAMAREQRALLRETILMGITRLVVERGNIKAGVVFDFAATEKIEKRDRAGTKDSHSSGTSFRASGGLLGGLLGGPSGGHTSSTQSARITVASAKSQADNKLAAKLTGSVDLTFKSDYFKLDNFAQMYGPQAGGGGAGGPANAGGAPALPPGQAPAAR